jgi:prefoldin subunit 5
MEDEMQVTIETYRNIIESYESEGEASGELARLRREMQAALTQADRAEKARAAAEDGRVVAEDEVRTWQARYEKVNAENQKLKEKIDLLSEQMGVPRQEHDQLSKRLREAEHAKSNLEALAG